jgi:hypothetical protein
VECVEGIPYVFLGRTLDLTLLLGGGAGGRGDLINFFTPLADDMYQYGVEGQLIRGRGLKTWNSPAKEDSKAPEANHTACASLV